jgi:hypothetical protein
MSSTVTSTETKPHKRNLTEKLGITLVGGGKVQLGVGFCPPRFPVKAFSESPFIA